MRGEERSRNLTHSSEIAAYCPGASLKRSRRVLARLRTAIKSPTPKPKLIFAHASEGLITEADHEEESAMKMGISFGLSVSAAGLAENERGRRP
jgi:hypothetical protein